MAVYWLAGCNARVYSPNGTSLDVSIRTGEAGVQRVIESHCSKIGQILSARQSWSSENRGHILARATRPLLWPLSALSAGDVVRAVSRSASSKLIEIGAPSDRFRCTLEVRNAHLRMIAF